MLVLGVSCVLLQHNSVSQSIATFHMYVWCMPMPMPGLIDVTGHIQKLDRCNCMCSCKPCMHVAAHCRNANQHQVDALPVAADECLLTDEEGKARPSSSLSSRPSKVEGDRSATWKTAAPDNWLPYARRKMPWRTKYKCRFLH